MTKTATKPKPKHPAPYTPAIIDLVLGQIEGRRGLLLDPLAGIGVQLARLVAPGRRVRGFEIEAPWADTSPLVEQADSTHMPLRARTVSTIVTSPDYGNRFGDHHKASERCSKCKGSGEITTAGPGSRPGRTRTVIDRCEPCDGTGTRNHTRRSYTHDIREQTGNPDYELHANNGGRLHYGPAYQENKRRVYAECWRVARPGCEAYLNVSDFYRTRPVMGTKVEERVPAAVWHLATWVAFGWEFHNSWLVPTPRMGYGANGSKRAEGEFVFKLVKP